MNPQIESSYKWLQDVPHKRQKIMKMVSRGLFFSPHYEVNAPSEIAGKIKGEQYLPFTVITDEDKTKINKARYRLFALLIPIHDRKQALQEFKDVALEWKATSYDVDEFLK